jgi:hypothetical protein
MGVINFSWFRHNLSSIHSTIYSVGLLLERAFYLHFLLSTQLEAISVYLGQDSYELIRQYRFLKASLLL